MPFPGKNAQLAVIFPLGHDARFPAKLALSNVRRVPDLVERFANAMNHANRFHRRVCGNLAWKVVLEIPESRSGKVSARIMNGEIPNPVSRFGIFGLS
jgi:hypothetical protein